MQLGVVFFFSFFSIQSLAFMTVVLMWICKRQIYDSKMINGLLFLAAISLLAKLGCPTAKEHNFKGKNTFKMPKILFLLYALVLIAAGDFLE